MFTVKLTGQELEWLHKLAETKGISASDYLRMLIRDYVASKAQPLSTDVIAA